MNIITNALNKYEKIPLPAKASIWFVFCSILQKGISLLTIPVFTRLMSTRQYGVYSTYLSWYTILLTFTSLNLFYGVFNNAMVKFEKQRDRYISSMQGIITVLTTGFFCIYLLFQDKINLFLDLPKTLILLLFAELLVTPALQFWMVRNRFDYKYKRIVAVVLLKSILNPLSGILLVIHFENKDIARVVSVVFIEVIVCGIIGIYQFWKGKCFFDKEFWKYAVLFNLPLIPHYLSGNILSHSDRIMISKLVGSTEVAFYSIGYNIGIVINIIITSINSSLTPWMYQKIRNGKAQEIKEVINILLIPLALMIMLVILLSPEALAIVAAEKYKEAVYVIPPVVASTFFFFLYLSIVNIEFYYEERRFVLIGSVVSAGFNLLLNWIFIPRLGYYAAGYTTLFCYIIYGLSHLGFSKIVIKREIGDVQVYDQKTILFASVLVLACTVLSNFLYKSIVLRYSVIILLAAAAFIKRKTIFAKLKRLNFKV